jgi:hypothetical protein
LAQKWSAFGWTRSSLESADVMKIDVEGYELEVLRGAQSLLSDKSRRPRRIFIDVHPYAWAPLGGTDKQLFSLLERHGYCVAGMDGAALSKITDYGEIIATSPEAVARSRTAPTQVVGPNRVS